MSKIKKLNLVKQFDNKMALLVDCEKQFFQRVVDMEDLTIKKFVTELREFADFLERNEFNS